MWLAIRRGPGRACFAAGGLADHRRQATTPLFPSSECGDCTGIGTAIPKSGTAIEGAIRKTLRDRYREVPRLFPLIAYVRACVCAYA